MNHPINKKETTKLGFVIPRMSMNSSERYNV